MQPAIIFAVAGMIGWLSRCRALANLILPATEALCRFLIDLVLPAVAGVFQAVEFSGIGFDVEQWCAIQDVNPVQQEHITFAAYQFNDTQADAIGPARCAGRKNALSIS